MVGLGFVVFPSLRQKEGARMGHGALWRGYSWFMFWRNSALLRTFSRRLMSSSMASTGESGLSTLRSTQMRCKSSLGMSSSSFLVAAALDVDGREDALIDELAVEDDFHVAGALELFEE